MDVYIGPEIIKSYKRLSYTAWHALAEFVDNSIQSHAHNKDRLDSSYSEAGHHLTVRISYTRAHGGRLAVEDNAMGMSQEELDNALRIGRPPADISGLSEFGMGLKTAACWFGNDWTVRTKKLGTSAGQSITFNVEQIASGNLDLHHSTFPGSEEEHFTTIEITDLNQQFYGQAISYIKTFLASIYRTYLKATSLTLSFNGEQLSWVSPVDSGNVHVSEGSDCVKEFEFHIGGKRVHGWIAVLERGSRANAGMTIIRRGRVIRGWPESWRPQAIFGQLEGSNDLVNQRLVGEINLDGFEVSHTKDDILWDGNDRDLLEEELSRIAEPYSTIAASYRKRGTRGSSPGKSVIASAMGMLEEEIRSPRFHTVLTANGDIPRERYEAMANPMISAVRPTEPRGVYEVGGLTFNVFLADTLSDRDPYLGIEIVQNDTLNIVINMSHPHVKDLRGRMGVLNHLKACTYEGIAQWKVNETWSVESPRLIRAIKDSLLRVGHTIDDPGGGQ